MKTFLVPISSLKDKKSTLLYAIDFAKQVGVKTIYGGILFGDSQSEELLKEVNDYAKKQGVVLNFRFMQGNTLDYIKEFCVDFKIDLIIAPARTPKTHEKLYLDDLSGGIVRKTDMPVLLIPEDYEYKAIDTVLTAIKSGVVKLEDALKPLESTLEGLNARMTLLQVKTPSFLPEDLMFDKDLAAVTSKYYSSENATLFQGVLEYIHVVEPDMICVFRRKRGFFKKLWSDTIHDNGVRKADFESRVPLLVLKGEQ